MPWIMSIEWRGTFTPLSSDLMLKLFKLLFYVSSSDQKKKNTFGYRSWQKWRIALK
jgi:hypothetical protein